MSNNQPEINLYQNNEYTPRQIISSFQPVTNVQEPSPEQVIPPLPITDASEVPEQQQQQQNIQLEPTPTSIMRVCFFFL